MRFFLFFLILTAFISCGEDKGNTNTSDKCKDVTCDEWKLCNSINGACETKENRCSDNGDCSGVQICDENHNCVNPIDPCEGQSCSNLGECAIINNTAKCVCNTGYTAEGLTCVDINECLTDSYNCPNGYTCENTIGGFICNEIIVDLCENITCDEWELCNSTSGACETKENRCSDNGDCSGVQICDENHNCVNPIDPCEGQSCSNLGECAIINNTAKCVCNTGYTAEGLTCVDINECLTDSYNCPNGYTCENTIGGFICNEIIVDLCENITCDEWELCNSINGNCETKENRCSNNGECSGVQICDINHNCVNPIDPCEGQSCSNHGVCAIINNNAKCFCETGYKEEGLTCVYQECIEDETKLIECGLNNNGIEIVNCVNGYWVNSGNCENEDICANGTLLTIECGINNNGIKTKFCSNGEWIISENCFDNDVCVNYEERTVLNICGLNNKGSQKQVCLEGQWAINTSCFENELNCLNGCVDEDVCVNGNIDTFENSCGLNTRGMIQKFCQNGEWIFNQCIDNDICIDGTIGDNGNSCGYDNSGNYLSECVTGQYVSNECSIWAKQFGTSMQERGKALTTDSNGNIYITSWTSGVFANNTNFGDGDVFLAKYNSAGDLLFVKQFGTSFYDDSSDIIIDNEGNIIISGRNAGNPWNMFLMKLNTSGDLIWNKTFGTTGYQELLSITIDSNNNIFAVGYTWGDYYGITNAGNEDAFIMKFNSSGDILLTKLIGTSENERIYSVKTDSNNNVYIAGTTSGTLGLQNFGGYDIVIAKYNNILEQQWIKQFGSDSYEDISVMNLQENNIYIASLTGGSLYNPNPNQKPQTLLLKYNTSGDFIFGKQFAIEERTIPKAIEIKNNEIYIAGQTGYIDTNQMPMNYFYNIFLVKYDNLGNSLLTKQFGTEEVAEYCNDMTIDTNDNMYFTGYLMGNLYDNTSFGSDDAFLIKWNE